MRRWYMSDKAKRKGSKYYWEGFDASENGLRKKDNPYRKVEGTTEELEKNDDPHFMWEFGYDVYIAMRKTFYE